MLESKTLEAEFIFTSPCGSRHLRGRGDLETWEKLTLADQEAGCPFPSKEQLLHTYWNRLRPIVSLFEDCQWPVSLPVLPKEMRPARKLTFPCLLNKIKFIDAEELTSHQPLACQRESFQNGQPIYWNCDLNIKTPSPFRVWCPSHLLPRLNSLFYGQAKQACWLWFSSSKENEQRSWGMGEGMVFTKIKFWRFYKSHGKVKESHRKDLNCRVSSHIGMRYSGRTGYTNPW